MFGVFLIISLILLYTKPSVITTIVACASSVMCGIAGITLNSIYSGNADPYYHPDISDATIINTQRPRNFAKFFSNKFTYIPPVETHTLSTASSTYLRSFPSKLGIDKGINLSKTFLLL